MLGRGMLGNGSIVPVSTPVRMDIDDVKAIAGGSAHALILKQDGTVWATGSNAYGELGEGSISYAPVLTPVQIEGLTDVVAIAASSYKSMALQRDGTVWEWGWIGNEQLATPSKVEGLPAIRQIATSAASSMALGSEGEVWVWGMELTDDTPVKVRKPTLVSDLPAATGIAASHHRGAAILANGSIQTWMNAKSLSVSDKLLHPIPIDHSQGAVQLAGSHIDGYFSFRKEDGSVWMWNGYWNEPAYAAVQVEGITDAVDLANRQGKHYALLRDGRVAEWQIGPDGKPEKPIFVQMAPAIIVNGQALELAVPPIRVDQSYYVPLRGVFEHIGAVVEWRQAENKVVVSKEDLLLEMDMFSKRTTLNGKVIPSELQPITKDYMTMVPLRFVAETLGAKVQWLPEEHAILIEF
ncbi:hypothetical protein XYCOK13_22980 [Xylanibacillus composti]|uniref:Copper amine oxidase-like N-terminal domain-containing protein n=2 Tax=Xylanibacillus composti TaxID=1572762 RepID=A0A8J4H601_9BACL|nr:hypothetical protein XYCOK13_22980 [Xylanibacillus composti]